MESECKLANSDRLRSGQISVDLVDQPADQQNMALETITTEVTKHQFYKLIVKQISGSDICDPTAVAANTGKQKASLAIWKPAKKLATDYRSVDICDCRNFDCQNGDVVLRSIGSMPL